MTRFQTILEQHKKLIAHVGKTQPELIGDWMHQKLEYQGTILALVHKECKCQKPHCNESERLQIHHIITRHHKKYMPLNFYIAQRRYWANLMVLCPKHHKEIHGVNNPHDQEQAGVIGEDKIKLARLILMGREQK